MTENIKIGNSPLAASLGAKISVAVPGRGMYLIKGHGTSPDALLKSMDGEVVLRLSGFKMLATLPFTSFLALQNNRNIASIGPVTVDVNRLSQLIESLKKAESPNGTG